MNGLGHLRARITGAFGGVACLAAVSACAPLPSTTPVFPALEVGVVDAGTKTPVADAAVVATRAGYRRDGRSSAAGRFDIPAAKQWHFLVYVGSPGVAPVPWHLKASDPAPLVLSVSAPGYLPATRTFAPSTENPLVVGLPDPLIIPLVRRGSGPFINDPIAASRFQPTPDP